MIVLAAYGQMTGTSGPKLHLGFSQVFWPAYADQEDTDSMAIVVALS